MNEKKTPLDIFTGQEVNIVLLVFEIQRTFAQRTIKINVYRLAKRSAILFPGLNNFNASASKEIPKDTRRLPAK